MNRISLIILNASLALMASGIARAENSGKLTLNAVPGKQTTLTVERMELKPGERGEKHTHNAEPCAFYVLEGVLTEGRGAVTRNYDAGQSFKIEGNTDHWFENQGARPARYLSMCL